MQWDNDKGVEGEGEGQNHACGHDTLKTAEDDMVRGINEQRRTLWEGSV